MRTPRARDRVSLAASTALAQDALEPSRRAATAIARWTHASVVVTLGGDGSMLETLHRVLDRHMPVYGMNCGSVGFLMNTFSEDDLPERLTARAGRGTASAAHARGDPHRRGLARRWRSTKSACCASCARAPRSASPSTAGCACAELIVRRRADLHAGGVHRVQPVRARSDRAAVGQPAAADADLRVPPPALARRAAAQHGARCCSRCWRPTSARPPRSPTSPRCATSVRVAVQRGPFGHRHGPVRSGPGPVGTHHRRAVHRLTTQGRFGTARPIT